MSIFLAFLAAIFFVILVLAAAMHPIRSDYSLKELKRRAKRSDAFIVELDRYELYPALVTLLRSVRAVLLVIITCLLIGAFGWVLGIVIALVAALVYASLARMKSVAKGAQSLYAKIEPKILDFVARFERVLHAFREPSINIHEAPHKLYSKEELTEIIAQSKETFGDKEAALLTAALVFPEKTVEAIMVPYSEIKTVGKDEFLGPLVLSELHKLGHSRLPVIDGDIDHVVGTLYIGDLLSLNSKKSMIVEDTMEPKAYYVRPDDTLEHALSVLLNVKHQLLIVANDDSKTVGLVTLTDLISQLVGRRVDEVK